jgi:hypothetical protein
LSDECFDEGDTKISTHWKEQKIMNNNTDLTGRQDVVPKKRKVLSLEEKRKRKRAYRREYYKNHREECLKRDAEYRKNNIEKIRKREAEYRKKNRDKMRKRDAEYYKSHREECLKRVAEYRKNHREECLKREAEYRERNRDKIRKWDAEYRNNNREKLRKYMAELRKKHREVLRKRAMEYYKKNREKLRKKAVEYRKNHREKILKREAEYRKNHREELRIKAAEYRNNHKEVCRRKNAEYQKNHREQINRRRRILRIKKKLIAENTITPEWQKVLDELDREMYLNDYRQNRLRDPGFDRRLTRHYYDHTDTYSPDPWNMVYNNNDCVETALFPEMRAAAKTEKPEIAQVHRIIEEECTEIERNLVDLYFGDRMKLVDISQVEAAQTGKAPTVRALSMRKRRLLDKVAKHLGVKHESRWVGPKSKQREIDEKSKNVID